MTKSLITLIQVLFYWIIANQLSGQGNSFKISGKIVDENNSPLEFVNVYINATSIFTSTDSLGRFTLHVPESRTEFELVVSMVGFHLQKQKFTKQALPKFLSIKLKNNNLAEVTINAKQDKYWEKKWKIFKAGLLGGSSFSRQCIIENRENIHLSYDNKKNIVFANSSQTFVILNKTLGYKIHTDLYQFSSDGRSVNYSALKYFEEDLDTINYEKQLENRRIAFAATPKFFFHTLANKNLNDSNFEVFKIKSMADIFLSGTSIRQHILDGQLLKVNLDDIYKDDTLSNRNIIYSDVPLLVFNKNENNPNSPFLDYPYKFSKIILPNHLAIFNNSGFLTVPNGIIFHFQWGFQGLSTDLPENYEVKDDLPKNKLSPQLNLVFETKKIDSLLIKSGFQTDQSIGFQKNSLSELKEDDDYFMKPDYAFRPSELEKSMDIYTLLKRVPGLRVIQNMQTGEHYLSLSGMSSNLGLSSKQDNTPALLMNKKLYSGRTEVLNALDFVETSQITEIGLVKYGSNAILGSRGGSGTIIIKFAK